MHQHFCDALNIKASHNIAPEACKLDLALGSTREKFVV